MRTVMSLGLAMAFLAGCAEAPDDLAPEAAPPAAGITELAPGWTSVAPGGETTCSDGTPYRFFARPGDPEKLLVFFQGGGGCWTSDTCDPDGNPTYTVNIDPEYTPFAFGAFNFDNPENPFNDHSVVFAPYCTGDVHLGASDTIYPPREEGGEPFTVRHQGRANAQAVLDWTFANVPSPAEVFVTGSSAGAIPSPFYAALVANAYPDARIAHMGDGAGGYRRMNGDARPDEQWGTFSFITSEPGFEDLAPDGFNYERLYIAAAKAHPDILFTEFDAAEDDVQKRFLALSGAHDVKLQEALEANHADIRAEVPNFRAFITGGESHTILRRPEFYTYAANGVRIRDWVADLAAFKPVADVTCVDCSRDTYAGEPLPEIFQALWDGWEDNEQQYVEPFKIFDNVYYVGIDWVAAYAITTSDGVILIDSLYGKWTRVLENNLWRVGINPRDVKYVINTHGHFDHAGGSKLFQQYGARVVMTEEDWQLVEARPNNPRFYVPIPDRDIVAVDGDVIELGDTRVELFNTPGHTEGVLTLRYAVRDGDDAYTAVSLGGVGLNFNGVERTETYIESYRRLQAMQEGVSVSLPNHAMMGRVFERAAALAERGPGDPHPFVDPEGYQADLATFIANAEVKLEAERNGTALDPLEATARTLASE